ncbi:ferrous iron transporter B [Thiobacillus sedimenti]|uniref:Ferrous iron transport protein B n=1 Tax=Thiobacillus sedimenti TaxID=3110231 RepID=A0ABZ1CLA8_9PROT|nr:ferrous iron transporter B [Thiobacillus sp. SCUT-2]WRS40171.1 ferrous iron transporter B [Thiobacillus sp. SCUT-2]
MTSPAHAFPLHGPGLRGARRPRVAIVGRPGSGKRSIFRAAASTATHHERLAGVGPAYEESLVEVGIDQISLVALPAIDGLHDLDPDGCITLKYLLWGDRWPAIARHEAHQPESAFAAPDVLLLVMDATSLERDIELALELMQLGRPMVVALNRMDEARSRRRFLNVRALATKLGVAVVPTVAHMGIGLADLFSTVVRTAREARSAHAQRPTPSPSAHIEAQLRPIAAIARQPAVAAAFDVPEAMLTMQLAENDGYFAQELQAHFPEQHAALLAARAAAGAALPRPLAEEIHADRHHRAAMLYETVSRPGQEGAPPRWQRWADDLFLHPRWGFVGTLAVFALVLLFVFEVSAMLDSLTVARLVAWAEPWHPTSLAGVLARAVFDGFVGLAGIVIPYMIPLVLLLVWLEESGIMHRVAFVVDRGFHRLGLHGGVALPFLMGLGCNVPALAATAAVTHGRDRTVASLLITFLPCSARSAILLAVGGKYLGGFGVFALFMLAPIVVSLVGKLLRRRYPETTPGMIQEIPPYAVPTLHALLANTWERSRDIVTIVLPLLVAGSVVLALLGHYGADRWIDLALTPVTAWWLGLPIALGVPILFGVLRKELSLLMVFQALGTQELGGVLDATQIATFLVFLTFYVPCVSTFAMMLKLLGRRDALYSVALSIGVALAAAGVVRAVMELATWAL